MQVTSVCDTRSTAFRGYLDKSVYNYINTSAANTRKSINNIASKMPKGQVEAALTKLEDTRLETTKNLEDFVSQCHPMSYFKIIYNDMSGLPNLVFNNKTVKLNKAIHGIALLFAGKKGQSSFVPPIRERIPFDSTGNVDTRLSDADLKQLKLYSEELLKVSPKSADELIYRNYKLQSQNNAHSVFGFFNSKKAYKKCKKFAQEIGLLPTKA